MAKAIILSSKVFERDAKRELRELFKQCSFEELFEGNFVLESDEPKPGILKAIKENEPVFVHNAFPVDLCFDQVKSYDFIAEEIVKNNLLSKERPFSIETITYGTPVKSRDIEVQIGSILESRGFKVDRKNLSQLIGIIVHQEKVYLGSADTSSLLYPYLNLSKRFSRETIKESRLNRAQFKLVEALERFRIELNGQKKYALDLGAAPGGWSKVLASKGYYVVSIDGGDLDSSLKGHPNILQIKQTINPETLPGIRKLLEEKLGDAKLDIITNDMNLDYDKSIGLINHFSDYLAEHGKVIMTLKSMKRNIMPSFEEAKEKLSARYRLVKAKHLDQNRQEITLYLQKNE